MIKTYKYRLYPNKKTQRDLNKTLDICRFTYNNILQNKIEIYKKENKTPSCFDINKILTEQKKTNEDLKKVYSQTLQNVSKRVHLAYNNFFRRVKKGVEKPGFPRFKGSNRYNSFTFPQNNGSFKIIDKWLHLSKIGKIQINLHRELLGEIKTCTIKKSSTNKWYVCFTTEVEKKPLPTSDKEVGIDVGLKTFAYLSDDTIIKNPRTLKKSEKKLNKIKSRFSKEVKGTLKRRKLGKIVCKVYEKISNQREDFCHKMSRKIINKYQTICIEDLNIKSMLKNVEIDPSERYKERLKHKGMNDVCWNKFASNLIYKAEEAGRDLVLVNPRNTSKMCSVCGNLVPKELKDRIHICDKCGLEMDRDKNASINILRLGLESLREKVFA